MPEPLIIVMLLLVRHSLADPNPEVIAFSQVKIKPTVKVTY